VSKIEVRDSREKGYFQVDNKLFDESAFGEVLGAYGIVVYICLCRHAGYSTQELWPSLNTIAQETGISKATVVRELKVLEAAYMLVRERRTRTLPNGNKEYTSTLYTLTHRNTWKIEAGRQKRQELKEERKDKASGLSPREKT
jgi:DNA-binding transcriptional regulator YhcF (GntR family)